MKPAPPCGIRANISLLCISSLLFVGADAVAESDEASSGTTIEAPPVADASPMLIEHPSIELLDAGGENVLSSGKPVSTSQTCGGSCHDVEYIEGNNYHAEGGFADRGAPGSLSGGRPWDSGTGMFGRWDPLLYEQFDPEAAKTNTALDAWMREFGWRHVGGGPAAELGAELDCFLCHIREPNAAARRADLEAGRFEWAATATLTRNGLARRSDDGWSYATEHFEADGSVRAESLQMVAPTSANCGVCHGLVHRGTDPVWPVIGLDSWSTETKGQIFSGQRMSQSAMNQAGKKDLQRPWDVHAARLMECSNCHYLINDPAINAEGFVNPPEHLTVDTRRQSLREYLKRPLHQFAKGHSAAGSVAPELDGSMRRCEDCHDVDATHDWLPYKGRHMERLLCESCHIPRVYAPARSVTDWTVITAQGGPRVEYRGVEGEVDDAAALVDGFIPALLPRSTEDDALPRLAPHNLMASWYWVHGEPARPVDLEDLERAFLDGEDFLSTLTQQFDEDGNGSVDDHELVLDSEAKTDWVRERLQSLGLTDPRIRGELQPFGLHHGVASGEWVTRSCDRCHSSGSVITAPIEIASVVPGGVIPKPVGDSNAPVTGEFVLEEDGRLSYHPVTMHEGFYLLGHDRWPAIDVAGLLMIAAVMAGAAVHGGIRYGTSRARRERAG